MAKKANLIIVRGLPGAGKSTVAKERWVDAQSYILVEADQYFTDADGNYKFVPEEIVAAHTWCQAEVEKLLKEGKNVVVANTFTRLWELKPYLDIAERVDVNIEVVTVYGDHQNIHNVPEESIQNMAGRWESYEGEAIIENKSQAGLFHDAADEPHTLLLNLESDWGEGEVGEWCQLQYGPAWFDPSYPIAISLPYDITTEQLADYIRKNVFEKIGIVPKDNAAIFQTACNQANLYLSEKLTFNPSKVSYDFEKEIISTFETVEKGTDTSQEFKRKFKLSMRIVRSHVKP